MIMDEAVYKFGGVSILPKNITAKETGLAVDVNGGATCTIVVTCGAYAGSPIEFSLVESDTSNGTFTVVSEEDMIGPVGSLVSGDTSKVIIFGYKGYKQYIKVVATPTGTTAGTAVSAAVIVGLARHVPTDAFATE